MQSRSANRGTADLKARVADREAELPSSRVAVEYVEERGALSSESRLAVITMQFIVRGVVSRLLHFLQARNSIASAAAFPPSQKENYRVSSQACQQPNLSVKPTHSGLRPPRAAYLIRLSPQETDRVTQGHLVPGQAAQKGQARLSGLSARHNHVLWSHCVTGVQSLSRHRHARKRRGHGPRTLAQRTRGRSPGRQGQ